MMILVSIAALVPPVAAAAAPAAGWGLAARIEADDQGSARPPSVAMDPEGNAFVVWAQNDGTRESLYGNHYTVGAGWGPGALMEFDESGDVQNPRVAADAHGNAIAVWAQSDGTRYNIMAARYVAGAGWEFGGLIETENSGDAGLPDVAFDPDGNAMAVWNQWDGGAYHDWAGRYVVGTGWSAPVEIATPSTSPGLGPRTGLDGSGNAVAVWGSDDGNIWANRFVPGVGWGTAALIETNDSGSADSPALAVERDGNALVVWDQWDGATRNIWVNRYVAGSGWGTPGLTVADNAGYATVADIAVDDAGTAVAAWQQYDGPRQDLWANRYVAGAGWGSAVRVESDDRGDAGGARVAMDAVGDAVVVWFQNDGTGYSVLANRFVPGVGWGTATPIETEIGSAYSPDVACDPAGNAVAAWHQGDGFGLNAVANRFVAPDVTRPALSLFAPSGGASINGSSVWVGGTTEPGATVSVDGNAAAVASDGSFGLLVPVPPGPVTITVTAWDASGNMASAFVDVTVTDPTQALQAQLDAARADLAAAQASLSALEADQADTHAQLAVAQAQLTFTLVRVETLGAALNTTNRDLATTRADLNQTKATGGTAAPAGDSSMLALVVALAGVALGAIGLVFSMRKRPGAPGTSPKQETAGPPG